MTPDPLTRRSIEVLPFVGSGTMRDYQCGCRVLVHFDRWWTCPYHEGFGDGIVAAREKAAS